ncbi:MAG TPA: hypothetical protein VKM72_36395 [Thermoanaerobaculia bacterium]|nr:hypothetical protein [Thermoanaerobaculia bacterium]
MPAIVLTYGEYEESAQQKSGSEAWKHRKVANVLAGYAKALLGRMPESYTIWDLGNASRSTFEEALAESSPEALFFFGHGIEGPDGGLQGKDSTLILDSANLGLLKEAILYTVACWSAAGFGRIAADLGAAVLGYREQLWVPLREPFISRMRPAVLSGALVLFEGRSISQAFTTTVEEYNALAQALFAEGTAAKVMATFIIMNVKSLTLLGNGQRTLTR